MAYNKRKMYLPKNDTGVKEELLDILRDRHEDTPTNRMIGLLFEGKAMTMARWLRWFTLSEIEQYFCIVDDKKEVEPDYIDGL